MFENFNPRNNEDMERLFSYLEKDKFNSLSLSDQNEILDFLIKTSNNESTNESGVKTVGFVKGLDGLSNFNIQKIIDDMGYEAFRDMMREAISKGGLSLTSISRDELDDLYKKAKNGTISRDEIEKLDAIVHGSFAVNKAENIHFSAYSIIHLYAGLLKKPVESDEVKLLADAEPFVNAAFIALLAALISRDDNSIGKMFTKHGFEKTKISIDDLTVKFSNLIIEYSKENDIAPERTLMALMNVIKILCGPLDTTMDYPNDCVGEVLEHTLTAVFGIESGDEVDELRKDSTKDSTNNSANAETKDSKNNNDIRKLLLDD